MTCHVEDHVHPIKVEKCPDGMSDVDAVVSDVLNDEAFRMANGMVSANSVNLARRLVLCAGVFSRLRACEDEERGVGAAGDFQFTKFDVRVGVRGTRGEIDGVADYDCGGV